MTPRRKAFLQFGVLIVSVVLLFALFPAAFRFVEMAALELRYMWWLVLLGALGGWLIWGVGRKPKK